MGPDAVFGTADDVGEQRLAITSSEPDNLDLDGDLLVYDDYRAGSFDVWLYDFGDGSETQVTSANRGQFYPRISGRTIVWQDARHNDPTGEPFDDVYVYVMPPE